MEKIFSKANMELAVESLLKKNDSCGIDGIYISQFREYWELNGENIIHKILDETYEPDIVQVIEIVNKNGKKRNISRYTCTDRVILDIIKRELESIFTCRHSAYSYAYQTGKGVQSAVMQAAKYIEEGKIWVVELDIKNFFDNIDLTKIIDLLEYNVAKKEIISLIKKYLYCKVICDSDIKKKTKGLIQGARLVLY